MTTESDKNKNQQGATYPYVPLSAALILAEAVKQLGGNKSPIPKSQLADALKENEKGQGFTFKIASAKCYGLIEGRSSYTLTESARRYFFPTSSNEKIGASLDFLEAPPGFAEIIKRFDGQRLPEVKMLANIFHTQLRVPESWSLRAAQYFIRSAQLIGVIDERGFLRFDSARHTAVKGIPIETASAFATQPPETINDALNENLWQLGAPEGYHTYTLPLVNGRKVTVLAPLDITPQEIKRLNKWQQFTLQVDWTGDEKETE